NQFIKAVKLHRAGLSGKGVTIALFDTGYEINHRAFDSTNIIATYDFINNDATVDELECTDPFNLQQTFHGTFTLGITGGYVPDSLIGVAPEADYILAKTEISCNGTEIKLEEDNWVAAAEWADSIGTDIISSSLGYTEFTDSGSYTFDDLDGNTALITRAADIAASKNILVVNSAGNDRLRPWGHIVTPADGDSVLAVGAVMPDSSLAAFSSPGPTSDGQIKPDIVTLGVGVFSAFHQGGFASGNGTSFSAPLTAGGAALALEHDATLTAIELLNLIRQTGIKFDTPDNNFGYGLYDATASADIIKFDLPKVIKLDINEFSTINVTTSGRTDSIPVLSAIDLPSWMEFTDYQNGRGDITVNTASSNLSSTSIGLIADVGYFIDTSYYSIVITGYINNPVFVGPNPFNDSLNIFVKPLAGTVKSISIYNSSGEIVWEKVNNITSNADVLIDIWNGRNQRGEAVTAGVYILIVNTDRQTHRVKLLKTN
ncbi:MAG: S8 family serine peptidase, partial [Candidatus Zixiibacteriota bacterium]